jgi:putative cell wall-binding protein
VSSRSTPRKRHPTGRGISLNVRSSRSPRSFWPSALAIAVVATLLLGLGSVGGSAAFAAPVGVQPGTSPTSGMVAAWGDNTFGESSVPSGLSGVTAIAAGGSHSLALKSDGTVVGWGANANAQLPVPLGLSGVTTIAAGLAHSLALKSDGTVVAWGYNGYFQSSVPSGLSGVTAIAACGNHSLALKSDGTVVAWGSNTYGESSVPSDLSGVTSIAAGYNLSLALKSDGTVVAWGSNTYGESSVPSGLSGVTSIAAGGSHSLAVKSDGTVVGWGYNSDGETSVPLGLSGVTEIAADSLHSLALIGNAPAPTPPPTDQNGNTVVSLSNATPCQDFVFLGVRGSGESAGQLTLGMGDRVTPMYDSFIGSMKNSHIAVAGIDYPALPVPSPSWGSLLELPVWQAAMSVSWHDYLLSIDAGVNATETVLFHRMSLRCPNERFVLAGYSQGAMAIHRTVFDLRHGPSGGLYDTILGKIAAVGTIGDGDRVAQDNIVTLGTSDTTAHDYGVGVEPFSNGAGQTYTSTKQLLSNAGHGLNTRWFQVCDDYDLVCDFGNVMNNPFTAVAKGVVGYQVHTTAYTKDNPRLVEAGQQMAQASIKFAANAAPSSFPSTPSATPAPASATPPAADSRSLSTLLAANHVDASSTTSAFVPASVSSSPGTVDFGKPFSGSMPWAGTDNFVDVYAYSTPVYRGTFPVVAGQAVLTNVDLSQLGAGSHQLVLVGQSSKTLSDIVLGTTSARISGVDRFATAVAIAKAGYPSTAPVVYVATGSNFPDALGAAPAAALLGGPLLLTPGDSLPTSVAAEITSLKPARIVLVGGTGAVSTQVETQLQVIAPVTRVAGTDRYDTARKIVAGAFTTPVASAYLATGSNFPDALSAAAAAGAHGEPVLLVNGQTTTIDSATLTLLTKLGVTNVTIAGGTAVVSPALAASVAAAGFTVTREGGTDRFATSQLVNQNAFPHGAPHAFMATGYQFPDALAGAALAGQKGSPLYVVPTGCVPAQMSADITSSGASGVTLLGGPGALNDTVLNLQPCS